jgi:hypothetical protein
LSATTELARQQLTLDALAVRWLAGEVPDDQYGRLRPRLEDMAQAAERARSQAAEQVEDILSTFVWAPASTGEPVIESLGRLVRQTLEGAPASGASSPEDKRRRVRV